VVLQYMCLPEEVDAKNRDNCAFECFVPIADNLRCVPGLVACPRSPLEEDECRAANFIWARAQVDDEFNCPHKCNNAAVTDPAQAAQKSGCGAANFETGDAPLPNLALRDGLTTERQEYTDPSQAETEALRFTRKQGNVDDNEAMHETWEWYDECNRRERNRGLFTADQNLRDNNLGYSSAVYTRQNPNNNRRGYECPEERDYWPYWHPSPWIDIAVLTDRLDMCDFYQEESQNVKSKHLCRNTNACRRCVRFNNEAQCVANGGRWAEVGAHNVPKPDCIQSPWSRVNHLGNGRYGQANTYNWTLPYIVRQYLSDWTNPAARPAAISGRHRCVLRMRYNISTDDYDAWRVNASFNNNNGEGIKSPVRDNPNVNIGTAATALRLAINTAQFGRTFQDRSHVFVLKPRPAASVSRERSRAPGSADDFFSSADGPRTLYNINVRGKRGNIVQTFPSVEYDFVPNQLHVTDQDLVHFQWTGSNTHNNGNPAGDGQAGDAGEGTGGTDRHNLVELRRRHFDESFPATWEENTMFASLLDAYSDAERFRDPRTKDFERTKLDWALRMSSAGYYKDLEEMQTKAKLNNLLNNAPASFLGGVLRFKKGTFNYMCTRNHNFSNRDQKGVLIVENNLQA
jgi:hypothetical protein